MALSNEEYVKALEQTFASPGWSLLVQGWEQRLKDIQIDALDPRVVKTWDDVVTVRTIAAMLIELINQPALLDQYRE